MSKKLEKIREDLAKRLIGLGFIQSPHGPDIYHCKTLVEDIKIQFSKTNYKRWSNGYKVTSVPLSTLDLDRVENVLRARITQGNTPGEKAQGPSSQDTTHDS